MLFNVTSNSVKKNIVNSVNKLVIVLTCVMIMENFKSHDSFCSMFFVWDKKQLNQEWFICAFKLISDQNEFVNDPLKHIGGLYFVYKLGIYSQMGLSIMLLV